MTETTRQTLYSLLIPSGLLILAYAIAVKIDLVPMVDLGPLTWAPDVVAVIGAILAWRFHRSRVAFGMMGVIIGSRVLAEYPPGSVVAEDGFGQVVYAAVCFLLPINLAVFAYLNERGVWNARGLTRLGIMAAQVLGVTFVAYGGGGKATLALQKAVSDGLHYRVFHPDFDIWTYITQPGLFAFGICLALLLGRALIVRHVLDDGFLGALVAMAAALHFVGKGPLPTLFLLAAAGILLVSLFVDSYHMAFTDELTALPGRRALMADLQKLGNQYSLAMMDVDHFKKFNDTYGHDVGDQVLRMVALCLKGVKGGGRAYRYGGEEFTIVMPGKGAKETLPYMEAVRKSVEAAGFYLRGDDRPEEKPEPVPPGGKDKAERVSVTISIGIAERGGEALETDQVMKLADQTLYKAKDGGRNRVEAC